MQGLVTPTPAQLNIYIKCSSQPFISTVPHPHLPPQIVQYCNNLAEEFMQASLGEVGRYPVLTEKDLSSAVLTTKFLHRKDSGKKGRWESSLQRVHCGSQSAKVRPSSD